MATVLGSLNNDFNDIRRVRRNRQNDEIKREQELIRRNNRTVRAKNIAPGKQNDVYPRLFRKYNKYGSKGALTQPYRNTNGGGRVADERFKLFRGRYRTSRQCMYVPKAALMKMAKDLGVRPFNVATARDFKKGSVLWRSYTTRMICEAMRESYISKRRKPIRGMTAVDDPRLREVKKSLEFVAARLRVPITANGKSKSMFRLSRDISKQALAR